MGLDLTVRKISNWHVDEFGKRTWTVTEVFNFRNCYEILDELGFLNGGFGFDNNTTLPFSQADFLKVYNKLTEQRTKLIDGETEIARFDSDTDEDVAERKEKLLKELDFNIGKLEEFIAEEEIDSDEPSEEADYDVNCNY